MSSNFLNLKLNIYVLRIISFLHMRMRLRCVKLRDVAQVKKKPWLTMKCARIVRLTRSNRSLEECVRYICLVAI